MKRFTLSVLSLVLLTDVCSAQQATAVMTRVGDTFRGHIQQVRTENVSIRFKNGEIVEGPRILTNVVSYSEDGRRRELKAYARGSLQKRTVETFLPGGQLESISVDNGDGIFVSRVGFEYDAAGRLTIETRYLADGSIKEKKVNQWNESSGLVAVTKSTGDGTTLQTSINSNNYSLMKNGEPKRSVWTTFKADGSRTENIFEVDSTGTHNDQQINYGADGSLSGKRVSIVDAGITRLEATEYDASGGIKKRTLQTQEYDSHHNLNKITHFVWNAERNEFQPFGITYHTIVYYK